MPTDSPLTRIGAIPHLGFRFVAGAVAGDIVVTGIKSGDLLLFVGGIKSDGSALKADLTDEFTISADDTINNTGGTSTDTFNLLIIWGKKPTGL